MWLIPSEVRLYMWFLSQKLLLKNKLFQKKTVPIANPKSLKLETNGKTSSGKKMNQIPTFVPKKGKTGKNSVFVVKLCPTPNYCQKILS